MLKGRSFRLSCSTYSFVDKNTEKAFSFSLEMKLFCVSLFRRTLAPAHLTLCCVVSPPLYGDNNKTVTLFWIYKQIARNLHNLPELRVSSLIPEMVTDIKIKSIKNSQASENQQPRMSPSPLTNYRRDVNDDVVLSVW